jgi:ABC-type transport system involved in multi-copper enzyme maturation permease subunit
MQMPAPIYPRLAAPKDPANPTLVKFFKNVNAGITVALAWLSRGEWLYGLAGPIFEKELRVSGRLRRSYVLRFIYAAVLSGFVAMVWLSAVTMPSLYAPRSLGTMNMAYAGVALTSTIIWFQFIALQLVAIVMLSTSISDEVSHRTLGVLMTTPINNVQIVIGKFLGRFFQLVLLMALSVPMLIVIRVLGGVTSEFILAATCLTLSTTAFFAAASMFFSVSGRNAPLVIVKTVIAMVVIFLILPMAWSYGAYQTGRSTANEILYYVNPHLALGQLNFALATPVSAKITTVGWLWNCLGMLAATVLLLLITMLRVRRAALRQLIGDAGGWTARRIDREAARPPRRIRGNPIIWREARARIFKSRVWGVIASAALLGVLFLTYWADWNALQRFDSHIVYVEILLAYGTLATAVITSGSITAEKESGVWATLLVTPASEGDIALGKMVGVLRRSLPAWLPLTFHLLLFVALGYIHWVALPFMAVIVLEIVAVLCASGIMFGVLLKRTVTATVANVLLAMMLWVAIPMAIAIGIGILFALVRPQGSEIAIISILHPGVQAGFLLGGVAGTSHAQLPLLSLEIPLPLNSNTKADVFSLAGLIGVGMVVHLGLAALFVRAAIDRMRTHIV